MGISVTMAPIVTSLLASPALFLTVYFSLLPISLVVYRLFLHPLAKVPGPRIAAITSLWYVFQVKKGRMLILNRDLHRKYGPVVRISPNEISFDSEEAYRAIYTGSHYIQKGDFYWALDTHPGKLDWRFRREQTDKFALNAEMDINRYRNNRRNIGPTYAASSVKKYGPRLDGVMDEFVAKLQTQGGQVLDYTDWVHLVVVECLGAVTLNWSPDFVKDGSDHGYLVKSIKFWREITVFGSLKHLLLVVQKWPALRPRIAKFFGVDMSNMPADYVPFEPRIFGNIGKRTAEFLASEKQGNAEDADQDMLGELLELTKKKATWKPHYAGKLAFNNFIAGHETTTSIATAALVSICGNPEVKARVQAELDEADGDIEKCTYTQACIKEALRMEPVTSMALWRKVPAGPDLSLHGYNFPSGTTVGVNVAAMHLNPAIFGPDASEFKPERWLKSPEAWRSLDRTSLAWGGGAHTCPGRPLAELMLNKIVGAVMQNFDVEIVERPDIESMDSYTYIALMTGIRARFLPRQKAEA
ncbi:cytochrome P450 [Hypoxylon trugodes]|uniref:cytochrome P450 n=1 Tax=Hypoxylon trugodes TaxID=326681 RepID=UPI00219CD17C|nr:cytochrome P450 [Hypoxylon trugodes]KAI1387522.1 cytochrome P450 [Hypoxylon trugodes]